MVPQPQVGRPPSHGSSFFGQVEVEARGLVGEAVSCFCVGIELSEDAVAAVLDGEMRRSRVTASW